NHQRPPTAAGFVNAEKEKSKSEECDSALTKGGCPKVDIGQEKEDHNRTITKDLDIGEQAFAKKNVEINKPKETQPGKKHHAGFIGKSQMVYQGKGDKVQKPGACTKIVEPVFAIDFQQSFGVVRLRVRGVSKRVQVVGQR